MTSTILRGSLWRAIVVTCVVLGNTANAQQYTPDQVLSLLDRQIRTTLGFSQPGASVTEFPTWLSLTYVGLEVPADNPQLVDLIAVQCPPAQNALTSYSTAHRLDQVYELILNSAALSRPQVPIPGVEEARAKIVSAEGGPTDEFTAFRRYRNQYFTVARLFDEASERGEPMTVLAGLQNELSLALEDWRLFGHKTDIEEALDTLGAADANGSLLNTQWRRELLAFHRNVAAGVQQGAFTNASIAIPRSTLAPSPEYWDNDAGWTKVVFEKSNTFSEEEESYRRQTRYGSVGGGFLFWRARASAGSTQEFEEHREVERASNLAFEFEVRRAVIMRPWLDQRFFFEPGFWTWRRPDSVSENADLPRVSRGSEEGFPIENQGALYIDSPINVPMVPSEVVVARNLKLTMTVSTEDYQKIRNRSESSASVSGRAFFFFKIGGGGSNVSEFSNVTEQGENTTFTLSFTGPVVIGFISNVVPQTPAPKLDGREWPMGAWGTE